MKKLIVLLFLTLGFTAFSQDSTTTFSYNYRKGMQHYNKGVDIVNAMHAKPEQTLHVDSLSPEAKTEFNLAIPLLYKAYRMKSADENVLKALQGSYFSLLDFEKANKYKKELEALKK